MRINDVSRVTVQRTQEFKNKVGGAEDGAPAAVEAAPQPQVAEPQKTSDETDTANDEMMRKAVEQANKSLKVHNRMIERSVHEVTHTIMYKLKDTVTNEVIQEFPPKKIQDMIAKMWELAGLFVDEKA